MMTKERKPARKPWPTSRQRSHFARRLDAICKERKLTLRAVGEAAGISYEMVRALRRGAYVPSLDVAKALAAVLRVPLDDLAGPLPELPEAKPSE